MSKYQRNTSSFAVALLLAIGLFFGAGNVSYAQKGNDSLNANTNDPQGVKNPEAGERPASAENNPSPGGASASADGLSTDAAVITEGGALFEANCKQCHAVHKQIVGPQLAGVYQRQSVPWLVNFIKYPEKTIKSGDAHAVELFNKYKQIMPNHDFLTDAQVISIISYIKKETENPTADTGQTTNGTSTTGGGENQGGNSTMLTAIIAILGTLLVMVLGVLVLLASVLTRYLQKETALGEADKEVVSQRFSIREVLRSRAFLGIVAFLFVALVSKVAVEGMISIGVQRGYAPTQPIPFSHKLHAGEYAIDCRYCHTGVEKGKSANIPSANICMNCHNTIKTGSEEIKKIHNAILNDQPIQWVRVHNLPDLAYFNHAQHVKVGGLACENCHGDVKQMEVVQQASLLTMGWCIDCHRKTNVASKGNAYYDKLVQMHSARTKQPMKVEDIGGLECSKCHY